MIKKHFIFILAVVVVLAVIGIVAVIVSTDKKLHYSSSEICVKEGTNSIVLKAMSSKYPSSRILDIYEDSSGPVPFVAIKIKKIDGKIVERELNCKGNYFVEQCNPVFFKEKAWCYTDDKNQGEDQCRLDECYFDVAKFSEETETCKKIGNLHKKIIASLLLLD